MKLKVSDEVIITAGKDKGQKGKINKTFPGKQKVTVEGINKYKKHVKPQGEGKPGGITEFERPLPVANVALLCPVCKQQTRVGYNTATGGKKERTCHKCKKQI